MTLFGEDAVAVDITIGDADISDDGAWRFQLTRRWASPVITFSGQRPPDYATVVWALLNPSTADALTDDATLRTCRRLSQRLGATQLAIVNLVPWRAREPAELRDLHVPQWVLARNDECWDTWLGHRHRVAHVICGWGACPYPVVADQARRFLLRARRFARSLECYAVTKSGAPRHPLYLPNSAMLAPYPPEDPCSPITPTSL